MLNTLINKNHLAKKLIQNLSQSLAINFNNIFYETHNFFFINL